MIMLIGLVTKNGILIVEFANKKREQGLDKLSAVTEAASQRLRPILMTTVAMVVGMIPMASGLGEGADQASPLGRAVIGGLIVSTIVAVIILPLVFSWLQGKTSTQSVSLDPEDKESIHYIPSLYEPHSQA